MVQKYGFIQYSVTDLERSAFHIFVDTVDKGKNILFFLFGKTKPTTFYHLSGTHLIADKILSRQWIFNVVQGDIFLEVI